MTGYTPSEHRRAIERLRADVVYDTAPPICPDCGQSASYVDDSPLPPGLYCDDFEVCGWSECVPPRDEDEAYDDAEFRRWREGRDAA